MAIWLDYALPKLAGAKAALISPPDFSANNSFRNSSTVDPASFTIPPIVMALIGLCRGITSLRFPSVMMMCLPCRSTQKPTFSNARTASR